MDLTPEERENVNRAIASRLKPADADDLPAEADPVDVRPTDPESVGQSIRDGAGPAVGSWTTVIDSQANEGVITIKGDYGIRGQIRAGINGWTGWLGSRNSITGYDDNEGNVERGGMSVTDRDPQVVLDRLYDSVNGPGAADRTRNEVTQGRAPAPEVGRDWNGLTDGARIRITPHEAEYEYGDGNGRGGGYVAKPTGDDPFDAVFVSYQPPSTYQPYGFVTYRPDGEENENVQRRSAIPAGLLPEPAAPLLGAEAPADVDSDDSDADYEPDPYAVPVLDRNSPRFVPGGLDDFAPAGQMAKVDANIEALRVLRTLRTEGRPATSDEQATLARWAGWGGVAGVFDTDKPEFAARLAEIEALLDPVEMRRAKRTTVNAHYTDPRVVEQVWGALGGLGFTAAACWSPAPASGNVHRLAPRGRRRWSASSWTHHRRDRAAALPRRRDPQRVVRRHPVPRQRVRRRDRQRPVRQRSRCTTRGTTRDGAVDPQPLHRQVARHDPARRCRRRADVRASPSTASNARARRKMLRGRRPRRRCPAPQRLPPADSRAPTSSRIC